MPVAQTSIDSYNAKKAMELLGPEQARVLKRILAYKKGITRGEIAHSLGMEKSSVSARVNELIKKGVVEEVGVRPDRHSKRPANVLKAVLEVNQ